MVQVNWLARYRDQISLLRQQRLIIFVYIGVISVKISSKSYVFSVNKVFHYHNKEFIYYIILFVKKDMTWAFFK